MLRAIRQRQWEWGWESRWVALLTTCQVGIKLHLVVDEVWDVVLLEIKRFCLPMLLDINSVLYLPHVVYPSVEAINIVKELVHIIAIVLLTPFDILLRLLVICLFCRSKVTSARCTSTRGLLCHGAGLSRKRGHQGHLLSWISDHN